ncbi:hypothetical protein [Plantibacter sp. YIM 135347]|uniref:hypothetical protein n=1 Tax=Plantibacter sp. YIM 135347 TaxID=3423919 RepID=UPI003D34EA5D
MQPSTPVHSQHDAAHLEARTTAHNGIPMYSIDHPGVCAMSLVFGVGSRDEVPTQAGITHLVEHVLLRLVQPVRIAHGGVVGTNAVEFFAAGPAADVAAFVNAIAREIRSVSSLDAAELKREKLVIEAEDVGGYANPRPGLLTYRFGADGLGRAYGAPTTGALTLEETVAWAERWLLAGNAVLTCLGAVPDELDVRLPGALGTPAHAPAIESPVAPVASVLPVAPGGAATPRLIASRKQGVGISLCVPAARAGMLGEALRVELLERLRHRSGLIYSVEVFPTRVDELVVQLDVVLDPLLRNVVPVTLQAVVALTDLAERGFSSDAIASARLIAMMDLDWEASAAAAHLEQLAVDHLRGWTTPDRAKVRELTDSVSPDDLTAVFAAALPSLIVAFDDDVDFTRTERAQLGLPIDPFALWNAVGVSTRRPPRSKRAGTGARGRTGARRGWRSRSGDAVLWLTGGRVLRRRAGSTTSFRLRDVVLLGVRPCGCLVVVDRWGRTDDIATEEWKHGTSLRKALIAALGEVLSFDVVRAFPVD